MVKDFFISMLFVLFMNEAQLFDIRGKFEFVFVVLGVFMVTTIIDGTCERLLKNEKNHSNNEHTVACLREYKNTGKSK